MSESDQHLIAMMKAKMTSDPERVVRILYDRHSSALLRFIYRFTKDQARAEEILHDVFVELLAANFREFDTDSAVKSWLFTLAKNKSLNAHRKLRREVSSENVDDSPSAGDMDEALDLRNALTKLDRSESSLPDDLRETWRLRRQGFGYQEIADRLAIPLGTVKSRFSRLVSFLREEMERR